MQLSLNCRFLTANFRLHRVNFFYLPNGQHHRLASKSGLSDHSKEYYDEYGVKIWGDHIALIDRCCESIDVYNWKRNGELVSTTTLNIYH